MKKLTDVVDGEFAGYPPDDVFVTDVTYDSRKVRKGYIFVALKGTRDDGHNWCKDAMLRGASAVVVERFTEELVSYSLVFRVPVVRVNSTPQALSSISKKLYASLPAIGITGTKGKSTTVSLVAYALTISGQKAGVSGSLWDTLTTPQISDTLRKMHYLKSSGYTRLVMEVTSIGLEKERVKGINFVSGAFLNFSQDHLDFHGDMQRYFSAKLRFFEHLKNKPVVLNISDEWVRKAIRTARKNRCDILTFSKDRRAEAKLISIKTDENSTEIEFELFGSRMLVRTKLLGEFVWENILAGALLCKIEGLENDAIKYAFESFRPLPGRMQKLADAPLVFVDYAHTPESLKAVLDFGKKLAQKRGGKLWVVFGCGGDRDKEKRPLMGKIAEELADTTIITSDNPRSESPEKIARDILEGMQNPEKAQVILERARAIEKAVTSADPKDVVIVAGKGHEIWQEIDHKKLRFSDIDEVKKALSRRLGNRL